MFGAAAAFIGPVRIAESLHHWLRRFVRSVTFAGDHQKGLIWALCFCAQNGCTHFYAVSHMQSVLQMDHGASTTTSDASAPELEDKPPCHLLTLPEDVLAQIVRCDDWFMALHWSMTCHKLHDVVTNMQPPMTVLDSIVLEPTFKTKPDSVLPLVDLFQFIWDESSDLLLKKMLLKKRRASYSIGQGLAKMFRAWTKTEAAQAWRQTHLTAHKVLESFTNGEDIGLEDIELDTVQIQDEYWECQLSVPNLHWDTDDRRLQKHLTAALQPLVDALTEFANTMEPNVPHVSIFISNYDEQRLLATV